jgi:hypothetical protein
VPVGDDIQVGREESPQMGKNIEVLAFHNAVGLWAVRNCEVGRDVKNMSKGGHDVSREVGGVVASKVERRAISSKYSKKGFRGRLSGIVDGGHELHIGCEAANYDENI